MKIFVEFFLSLIGSLLVGIVGLFVGAIIGGNFGFPSFGGNAGYESGGIFFAILGISLGSFLVIRTVKKRRHEEFNNTVAVITLFLAVSTGIVLFDYGMPGFVGLVIFLLPSVALMLATNWPSFFKLEVKNK